MRNTSQHIPQRTCVACRKTQAKRELLRLVCLADGSVEVDPTGKKSGRGAYLCHSPACWEAGIKRGRLEHALRTTITPENREQLIEYGKELL